MAHCQKIKMQVLSLTLLTEKIKSHQSSPLHQAYTMIFIFLLFYYFTLTSLLYYILKISSKLPITLTIQLLKFYSIAITDVTQICETSVDQPYISTSLLFCLLLFLVFRKQMFFRFLIDEVFWSILKALLVLIKFIA